MATKKASLVSPDEITSTTTSFAPGLSRSGASRGAIARAGPLHDDWVVVRAIGALDDGRLQCRRVRRGEEGFAESKAIGQSIAPPPHRYRSHGSLTQRSQ